MMKKLILVFSLFTASLFSQNYSDSLKIIEDQFKSFQYAEVIKSSNYLLKNQDIPVQTEINIYLLKGISHFALSEDTLAKHSFIEILKRDSSFSPDSATTSPKVIGFFNRIKTEYLASHQVKEHTVLPEKSGQKVFMDSVYRKNAYKMKTSITRSMMFPGLGHLYLGDKKGWFYTIPGAAALISSVYFIFKTESLRNDYINAVKPSDISSRYNSYNTAYKIRNYSIIVFAATWIISQIDMLSYDFFPQRSVQQSLFILADPLKAELEFRIHL